MKYCEILRDLPVRSAGKDQFSAACGGKFNGLAETESESKLNSPPLHSGELYNEVFHRSEADVNSHFSEIVNVNEDFKGLKDTDSPSLHSRDFSIDSRSPNVSRITKLNNNTSSQVLKCLNNLIISYNENNNEYIKCVNNMSEIMYSLDKTPKFPSQATENWSSPTLRSGEALKTPECNEGELYKTLKKNTNNFNKTMNYYNKNISRIINLLEKNLENNITFREDDANENFENHRTFKEREAIEYSPECNEGEFNVLAETESESKLNLSERSVDKLRILRTETNENTENNVYCMNENDFQVVESDDLFKGFTETESTSTIVFSSEDFNVSIDDFQELVKENEEPIEETHEEPYEEQPEEPTPEQPEELTQEQPEEPTPEQPEEPTPEQPEEPTPEQPEELTQENTIENLNLKIRLLTNLLSILRNINNSPPQAPEIQHSQQQQQQQQQQQAPEIQHSPPQNRTNERITPQRTREDLLSLPAFRSGNFLNTPSLQSGVSSIAHHSSQATENLILPALRSGEADNSPVRYRTWRSRPVLRFNQNTNIQPPVNRQLSLERFNETVEYINYRQNMNNNEVRCPISLEEFNENEVICRIKHCSHIFKITPLINWMKINTYCPVCRYDLNVISASSNENQSRPNSSSHTQHENWSFPTLRSGESLNHRFRRHQENEFLEENPYYFQNFPLQSMENWSSIRPHSRESFNINPINTANENVNIESLTNALASIFENESENSEGIYTFVADIYI
jgi:hypothetical protein